MNNIEGELPPKVPFQGINAPGRLGRNSWQVYAEIQEHIVSQQQQNDLQLKVLTQRIDALEQKLSQKTGRIKVNNFSKLKVSEAKTWVTSTMDLVKTAPIASTLIGAAVPIILCEFRIFGFLGPEVDDHFVNTMRIYNGLLISVPGMVVGAAYGHIWRESVKRRSLVSGTGIKLAKPEGDGII